MPNESICDFAELITYVAGIEGIDRIRYTTSHPVEFSDNLISAYAEVPELVSHLHLPVQSGSDRILSAMKRGHTAIEYKSKNQETSKKFVPILVYHLTSLLDFLVKLNQTLKKQWNLFMKWVLIRASVSYTVKGQELLLQI